VLNNQQFRSLEGKAPQRPMENQPPKAEPRVKEGNDPDLQAPNNAEPVDGETSEAPAEPADSEAEKS
jgi:hypothetical protein